MRKLLMFVCLSAYTLSVSAQGESYQDLIFDEGEDTAKVTLNEIVKTQAAVTNSASSENHLKRVWGRKVHFNISYNKVSMSSQNIDTPYGGQDVNWKNKYGFGIQWGETFKLHKKPIAEMLMFGVDYDWMDMNFNHYKMDPGYTYNSSIPKTGNLVVSEYGYSSFDGKYYYPWGLDKYELSYGMAVGPNIAITPFTKLRKKNLDYIKLGIYFHVGYNASFMKSNTCRDLDANQSGDRLQSRMQEALRLQWGIGLYTDFGFSLSWKSIGIGYSIRSSTLKYTPMATKYFEEYPKTKFKQKMNRVYLNFRF